MKLITYRYDEPQGWDFSEIAIRRVNLFVGETGAGKSRLLNTISSIGDFVSGAHFKKGCWNLSFRDGDRSYKWLCKSTDAPKTAGFVDDERLSVIEANGSESVIYDRKGPAFNYDGKKLPLLSPNTTGLYLFREEPAVLPIYEWFKNIRRRNFYGNDLVEACTYQIVTKEIIDAMSPDGLLPGNSIRIPISLSIRLHLLKRFNTELFFDLVNLYRGIFPNIESCDVADATELKLALPVVDKGKTPVFFVKEKGVAAPVALHDLSSGMQKVLLIMTDILTLPKGGVYLIDEYENSLGINAIGFLPEILLTYGQENQYFITSHHPYLINNMPVQDWQVFHRRGSHVTIKSGQEFAEKFGSSKQQAFAQLINDPFYTEGA